MILPKKLCHVFHFCIAATAFYIRHFPLDDLRNKVEERFIDFKIFYFGKCGNWQKGEQHLLLLVEYKSFKSTYILIAENIWPSFHKIRPTNIKRLTQHFRGCILYLTHDMRFISMLLASLLLVINSFT